MSGHVTFVGAGPGDPDLITVKGLRALQEADVLVYDRLASSELVESVPKACRRIYVGKRKHLHVMSQQQINQVLVEQTLAGRHVVRLKGGAGFSFGRGGEVIDALETAGVPWRVVPGVTAATGAGAALNMALTHRDYSQALTLITAQRRPGGFDIDWVLAMRPQQTVVFYMGLSLLGDITQGLLGRGMPGSTPFAVVSKATQPDQLLITGTLSDIEAACHGKAIPSPALLIMGHSVSHIREQPALVQECQQRILLNRETGTKPVGSDLA